MNIVLLQADEIAADGRVQLTDHRALHIRTVLRVEPGQEIRVGILDGPKGIGRIERSDDTLVQLECRFEDAALEDSALGEHALPRGLRDDLPLIDLMLALPRPKVIKRLWAQLAALGVGRIILTNAAKVERNAHPLREDHGQYANGCNVDCTYQSQS